VSEKPISQIQKNSRETIQFRLGTFKKFKFVDLRTYIKEGDKDPVPTPKGLTVSPALWPQFRKALGQVEAAMVQHGWLAPEDLAG